MWEFIKLLVGSIFIIGFIVAGASALAAVGYFGMMGLEYLFSCPEPATFHL